MFCYNNRGKGLESRFFNKFLFIDAKYRSKISSDQKRLFFAVSLYPLSFFANTPFKENLFSELAELMKHTIHWTNCTCSFSNAGSNVYNFVHSVHVYNNSIYLQNFYEKSNLFIVIKCRDGINQERKSNNVKKSLY